MVALKAEVARLEDAERALKEEVATSQSKYEALVAEQTELKRKYSLLEEKHDELVPQKVTPSRGQTLKVDTGALARQPKKVTV